MDTMTLACTFDKNMWQDVKEPDTESDAMEESERLVKGEKLEKR
jgi:hypothetical protein